MQTIPLKPNKKTIKLHIVALFILTGLSFLFPLFIIPISLGMSYCACPLIATKEKYFSILAIVGPSIISVLYGFKVGFVFVIALINLLPLVVTYYLQKTKNTTFSMYIQYYLAAYSIAILFLVAILTYYFPPSLYEGLATAFVNLLKQSPFKNELLYQMINIGYINVPEEFSKITYQAFLENSYLQTQLLMSFKTMISSLCASYLPVLIVQMIVVPSLFLALHIMSCNHSYLMISDNGKDKTIIVAIPPKFSTLTITSKAEKIIILLGIISIFLRYTNNPGLLQLSLLLYAIFVNVFSLLGASILLHLCVQKFPNQKVLFSILVGVLYVLLPTVLLLFGILDGFMHFRQPKQGKQGKNKEDIK